MLYWKYKAQERVVQDNLKPSSGPHLGYRFLVPLPERLAGISYIGHAARLRLVLERARNGKAILVGALGGSITFGQGVGGGQASYVKLFTDWLNAALPTRLGARPQAGQAHLADPDAAAGAAPRAADGADDGGVKGASRRRVLEGAAADEKAPGVDGPAPEAEVEAAGAATGAVQGAVVTGSSAPPNNIRLQSWSREKHDSVNGAVPGTQSSYMSSCLRHHLPPGVDLVLVEYATNDSPAPRWAFSDPGRRALERLIRKLLRLSSRPAVVLVNMYAIGAAHGKYLHTAERDFQELATYYSLPSVSLKAAVMPSAAVGGAEEVSYGAIFNGGHNHPGHGGHVVVTELLITLCLDLLRSNGNGAGCEPRVTGRAGGDDGTAAALAAAAARPLPPPLAEDNYESSGSTCFIGHDLQGLVLPPHEGWEWTDEGRNKWGYVAMELGHTLLIKINTQLVGNRSTDRAAAKIVVQIAYLQSYHGMGTARVSCQSGCGCRAATIDAFDRRPVSVTAMYDMQVSQHAECVLALKTNGPSKAAVEAVHGSNAAPANGSEAGGGDAEGGPGVWSKFKLLGVVVGEEPGASEGGVTWVRDESYALAHAMKGLGSSSPRQRRR